MPSVLWAYVLEEIASFFIVLYLFQFEWYFSQGLFIH